jgi:predicted membrane channel-forming protein YqfA (hemolysin III family)
MMGGMSDTTVARRLALVSVLPVWVLAVVGAVLALTVASDDRFAWLLLVLVGSVLVGFVVLIATLVLVLRG